MTEAEWLTSRDPMAMLQVFGVPVSGQQRFIASDRRLRLFACACCRQVWHLLEDDYQCECPTINARGSYAPDRRCPWCRGTGRTNRSRGAVEVAERYADGLATEEELNIARQYGGEAYLYSPRRRPFSPEDAVGSCIDGPTMTTHLIAEEYLPFAVQAAILRDIFGNPWKPNTWAMLPEGWLSWHDGLIPRLAEAAYQERAGKKCERCNGTGSAWDDVSAGPFVTKPCDSCHGTGRIDDGTLNPERLAVLADALEEAGCTEEKILRHLRGWERVLLDPNRYEPDPQNNMLRLRECWRRDPDNPLPHVRGCWVIDLLTGRS